MYVRVRCDVQDLDLSAVDACQSAPVSIVGKHLCGGCTDLSMRANCHWHEGGRGNRPGFCCQCDPQPMPAAASPRGAESTCAPSQPRASPPLPPAAADVFIVATCCHHRMTWDTFAGQQHWQLLGFTLADFDTARRVSAWHNLWGAACVAPAAAAADSSREERSFEWMKSVGRAAKDVFDACRCVQERFMSRLYWRATERYNA